MFNWIDAAQWMLDGAIMLAAFQGEMFDNVVAPTAACAVGAAHYGAIRARLCETGGDGLAIGDAYRAIQKLMIQYWNEYGSELSIDNDNQGRQYAIDRVQQMVKRVQA